jgi:hypothetical protein
MKIWSTPHSDMGEVREHQLRLQLGNRLEQTLLFAGNPVYPAVLIHVTPCS